jgi:hypothetical protein
MEPGASFYGSDKYTTSDDDITTPALRLSKRKRDKSAGPAKSARAPTNEPRKARRVSAGQGMTEVANSLAEMADAMKTKRESKARKLPSTSKIPGDPQERAITFLEEDLCFSDNEMYEIFNLFRADPDLANVYSTIKTSRMHPGFIQRHLVKVREE